MATVVPIRGDGESWYPTNTAALRTYTLEEAADVLHMNAEVLRRKAKAGLVKVSKPGKRLVFHEGALVEYLNETETGSRRAVPKEIVCSISAVKAGGWTLRPQTESVLDARLEQRTKRRRKNSTTD